MPRVLLGQLDELAARPALRHQIAVRGSDSSISSRSSNSNGTSSSRARSGRAGGSVRARYAESTAVVALVLEVLEKLVFARQQFSAANAQQRDARVVAVARVADHVAIAAFDFHHDGRLFELLQMPQRIAQLGRALEVQALRRGVHALAHATRHFGGASVEIEHHLVDHRAVFDLRSARECTAPCSGRCGSRDTAAPASRFGMS